MDRDILFKAAGSSDSPYRVKTVQHLQDGANVKFVRRNRTPLIHTCMRGNDDVIRILLDAGADARWRRGSGGSAILMACRYGRQSTVELLIDHDHGLLDTVNDSGVTPLLYAINRNNRVPPYMVSFLLVSGADPHHVDQHQRTVLHHAVRYQRSGVVKELIVQHNANIFAVDTNGRTPFDMAANVNMLNTLLEMHCNKLTLHELLKDAEYSFAEDEGFHPPLMNPLQIILPLGKLTLKHFRTLLNTLDPVPIRNRDDTGKVPFDIACQTNAPVEVLTLILKLDPAVLHIADFMCGTTSTTNYERAISGGAGWWWHTCCSQSTRTFATSRSV